MKNPSTAQRPKYQRGDNPPPIKFQGRDSEILRTIQKYDGVLSRRHLKKIFWSNKSGKAMQRRLSKLFHNGYLDWPNAHQRKTKFIPESLVWIGWKGIIHLASLDSIYVEPPKKENENQMRILQARLRKHNIRWVREPNWNQLVHDFHVIDFRLSIENSVKDVHHLYLENWIPESKFRSTTDNIKYSFVGNNGKIIQKSKGVIPDGFFIIADAKRFKLGQPGRARFLLEIDMSTHDNNNFGIEKAIAGAAYIHSKEYKKRFNVNSGRWLIVTTGEVRMKNLMAQTEKRVKDYTDLFYFTTLKKIFAKNLLTDKVWWQINNNQANSLPFEGE
jgi:hypothetical protein